MIIYNEILPLHEAHDHIWIVAEQLSYVLVWHDSLCIIHGHLK